MNMFQEKTLQGLWRVWSYVHKDIYRVEKVSETFQDLYGKDRYETWYSYSIRYHDNYRSGETKPKGYKFDYVKYTYNRKPTVNIKPYRVKEEYAYISRNISDKIRRKFNMCCRPEHGRKSRTKMNDRWSNFCDNFHDFIQNLHYDWEETCENNKG